jgi:proline iminopeptidase
VRLEVNGIRLWFDVEGQSVVPDGPKMRDRPAVILIHGGPGSYDHSYFKPDFSRLTSVAQVIYLDLRGHGRSTWGEARDWSFEACADDLRSFCDVLDLDRPVVFGHSMGGFVAMLYGVRHPGHAGGLILQSTNARFDLGRLVEGMRTFGGAEVAALAERSFRGDQIDDDEWRRVFETFGPNIPGDEELARRIRNPDVGAHGMDLYRDFDVVDQLTGIDCPALVCVGDMDAVTPVAASREILEALRHGVGTLEILEGAGHFPWKDVPDRYWPVIESFVATMR